MDERRNHYRVLHLQPDAPFEVVRANHRALMVRLRAHPDLGGDAPNAAYLNAAYATLRDPKRRKAYDRELLSRYDIRTLAHSSCAATPARPSVSSENQRNYYRVLQVQPDAPVEIIESGYKALRKAGTGSAALLETARAALTSPARRRVYDRVLAERGHLAAVAALAAAEPRPKNAPRARADAPPDAYRPLIAHYCAFCKTPHAGRARSSAAASCVECASPLYPPPAELLEASRRAVARVPRNDALEVFAYWPARGQPGRLVDLSPTGLQVRTPLDLQLGDVVKIDAPAFRAVGAVAHRNVAGEASTGVRFLTVCFAETRGTFVSQRA